MEIFVLFICMLFCHIVDDYYLQGILASLKQRSWWEKNAPDSLYKHDYIMALFMHSASWSFMIMLPLLFYCGFAPPVSFAVMWVSNTVIHGIVDDLKANKRKINLIHDQCIHLIQIIITLAVCVSSF